MLRLRIPCSFRPYPLYANIYAPQSDVTLSGSGSIYGSIVGKSITMSGSSSIIYDLGLVPPGSSAIALVK